MTARMVVLLVLLLAMAPARGQSDSSQPGQDSSTQDNLNPRGQQNGMASGQNPNMQSNGAQSTEGQPTTNESEMEIPPPVSGSALPTTFANQERSNYLGIGLTGGVAYIRNVFVGQGGTPVNDEMYSFFPSISLQTQSKRWQESFSYAPGFQSYQHVTALNDVSQNASANVSYRFGPYSTLNMHDTFLKTSNVFSQPYSLSAGTVSGSPGAPAVMVIAPYANQISNEAGGVFSRQFSRRGMFGLGGGTSQLDYPNPGQAAGLYNSNTYDGNAFFNLRLSQRQYLGVTPTYFYFAENLPGGTGVTQTTAPMPYYAFYFRKDVYFSAAGGPLYYDATFPGSAAVRAWTPAALATFHAATSHTVSSISYQRSVTGGGGLLGAFTTDSATVSFRLQLSRDWSVGSSGSYTNNREVLALAALNSENGHIITAAGSVIHNFSQHFSAEMGYDFLHESYGSIPLLANAPNTQSFYGMISCQLRRPLGR